MPHVNIKHLPAELDERRESALVSEITEAVKSAFGVDEGVISITLESVAPEVCVRWLGVWWEVEGAGCVICGDDSVCCGCDCGGGVWQTRMARGACGGAC